jgi:hypothetical protein
MPWGSLCGDQRRRLLKGLDQPVGLRQRRHGWQREVSDGGAAAAYLLHGEQRGDGIAEDALLGDGEVLPLLLLPGVVSQGRREDGFHHGLAVLEEPGDELSSEEWLLQHAGDDGEAEQPAGVLVVLLEDLGEAGVVDAVVVEEQHHLAVEVHHLTPDARDLRRRRRVRLGSPLDHLLQLLRAVVIVRAEERTRPCPYIYARTNITDCVPSA